MRRRAPAMVFTVATVACLASLLWGCGRPRTIASESPRATAEAFVAAMKAGDHQSVVAGYDYEQTARTENPDWEQFPEGQRTLIIGRLQEAEAQKIEALAGMMAGEVQVGSPTTEGDRASVPLTIGPQTLTMHLIQVEGLWKVLDILEE